MTVFLIVEFAPVSRKLDVEFIKDYVNAVIEKPDSARVLENDKRVKLESALDGLAAEIYERGRGGAIEVEVKSPRYWFSIGIYPEKSGISGRFTIRREEFHEEGEKQAAAIEDFIRRCVRAYNFLHPEYGRGDWDGIFDQQSVSGWKAFPESVADVRGNLRYMFWLNFYGPELVAKVGIQKFRTVPYGRLEELADGGVLLIRGEHPNEYSENRYIESIRKHLFSGKNLLDRLLGK